MDLDASMGEEEAVDPEERLRIAFGDAIDMDLEWCLGDGGDEREVRALYEPEMARRAKREQEREQALLDRISALEDQLGDMRIAFEHLTGVGDELHQVRKDWAKETAHFKDLLDNAGGNGRLLVRVLCSATIFCDRLRSREKKFEGTTTNLVFPDGCEEIVFGLHANGTKSICAFLFFRPQDITIAEGVHTWPQLAALAGSGATAGEVRQLEEDRLAKQNPPTVFYKWAPFKIVECDIELSSADTCSFNSSGRAYSLNLPAKYVPPDVRRTCALCALPRGSTIPGAAKEKKKKVNQK